MEATCNHCTFWAPQAPVVQAKENFGECNKLSPSKSTSPEFILPVLNDGKVVSDQETGMEYITGASFGCNQFASA